jgi:hypothetical protein
MVDVENHPRVWMGRKGGDEEEEGLGQTVKRSEWDL